ncbi:MAG: sigma-54 interaction domain-containing protein [Anaerovoracaceae bacterium]
MFYDDKMWKEVLDAKCNKLCYNYSGENLNIGLKEDGDDIMKTNLQERLDILLENISCQDDYKWDILFAVLKNGQIIWMNDEACSFTGVNYNEEITYRLSDIVDERIVSTIRKCKVKEEYAHLLLDEELIVSSLIDADINDEEGDIYVIGMKSLQTLNDMADEIARIDRANYELKEMLNNSFDGIYITDRYGTTLMVNAAHERLSGIKKERLLNRKIESMVEKGIFSGFITNNVIAEKKPVTIMQDVADTQKSLLITGSPVYNEDKDIVKVVTNVRDVTELISLQKELKTTKAIVEKYRGELFDSNNMKNVVINQGSKFEHVMSLAKKVASRDSTVLILGETGTGKEVVAQHIFSNSCRNEKNYLKINCGAIPGNLLESELFGYVKGAFTGADPNGKLGMFEIANNGTLFLDEIGELPMRLQASLLRVLQDGEITRVGDTKSRKVNVRIIAATNRDLVAMIKDGKFRSDLYYRLNVVSITIPPLRERKDEIPGLVEETVRRLNKKYNENKVVTADFIDTLMEKEWYGNIRELENYVEKFFVIQDDDIIDVPYAGKKSEEVKESVEILECDEIISMKEAIENVEREQIERAMKIGKSTYKAAELLGMSQSTFFRKYRKLVSEK